MVVGLGFPGGSAVKNLSANAEDVGSIPQLGKSAGEGNGNPFQYCCLENPMDRGAWQDTVHRVARVRHDLETEHSNKVLIFKVVSAGQGHMIRLGRRIRSLSGVDY